MHNDLKFAGMLPPLDAPHHLRSTEWAEYREGLVLRYDTNMMQSIVDIGLERVRYCLKRIRFSYLLHSWYN